MKTGRPFYSTGISRALGALAIVLLIGLAAPCLASAETAVGTTISNTVTVNWTGGSDTDTVTFDVVLKETAPVLAFTGSTPADLTNDVGEGQPITLQYTLTAAANGVGNYTLQVASVDTTTTPPTGLTINEGTLTLDLGASMALQGVSDSADVLIPGLAADHGLADGQTVIINNNPYTITGVVDDGTDTTITLDSTVTIDAGTPIYQQVSFDVTLTTGTGAGTHAVTSDAYVTGDITKIATDTRTITVSPAALTVAKSVLTDGTPQPGETITYTIDVSNTTTSPAANVIITDPIPAFTFFAGNVVDAGCTVDYSSDDGLTFGGIPADPATVTNIRFDCGTLAGSDTIQIKFDVTIE